MSTIPNQGFQPSDPSNTPRGIPNEDPSPNNTGTRNSIVFGSNLSISGGVSITVTDNSQLITGDNMQVHVATRSNPTINPPHETALKT